jgi:tRNA wybutosine-synthesizing protein 4
MDENSRIESQPSSDAAVQGTTEEASISKLSAASMGYFADAYLRHFVRPSASGGYRRSPLVHRGYYSRVSGIRQVVAEFFRACAEAGPAQVVNLGAGLDSLGLWILENFAQATIFEVDHPEVVAKKSRLIAQTAELRAAIGNDFEVISDQLRTPRLKLVAADLRSVEGLKTALQEAGMRGDRPTLFLAECVLIYMHATHSDAVLAWAAEALEPGQLAVCAVYEQTNPNDAFGRVMVKALAQRGCPLLGIAAYPRILDQTDRFRKAGFHHVDVATMNEIFDHTIPADEFARIKKIELFDEFEEWRLMQAHYFIAVATNFPDSNDAAKFGNIANIWTRKIPNKI